MYSQIFVPTRRYHSSSRLEASPFRRRRRKPSECIYVYMCVCVCVRALAFFSIPHSKVEFISRPNALGYVRLLRLSLPYSSRFDPLLLLLLLSPFSFRDERLFASPLTHHPLPFRGDLSSGVQVPPPRKSGMAVSRFYSILGWKLLDSKTLKGNDGVGIGAGSVGGKVIWCCFERCKLMYICIYVYVYVVCNCRDRMIMDKR